MPKFSFQITKDITATAQVEVEADTIEAAQEIALKPSWFNDPANAKFEIDDENLARSAYLPDPDEYEEIASSPSP